MKREDDEFFEQLQGCRNGKNATKPAAGYTGGVNAWCTCNGFIVSVINKMFAEKRQLKSLLIHKTFLHAHQVAFYFTHACLQ